MKKSILLGTLLVLILVAMCLPWAMRLCFSDGPDHSIYDYWWLYYPLGILDGNIFSTLSFLLALAALPLAFRSTHRRGCSIACGILLMLSAAAQLYVLSLLDPRWFTPLTWSIIAMLAALGLFALLGFREKAEKPA